MSPNTFQYRMLSAMCAKPCSVRTFTENGLTLTAPARHVERAKDEMLEAGLIEPFRAREYRATEAGHALVAQVQAIPVAAPRVHCSASQPNWTPPKWEPTRRGASDHLQFSSRGIGA